MSRTVLVTGRAGFLGTALAGALSREAGTEVRGTSLRGGPPGTVLCDLRDRVAVDRMIALIRPDAVFHLAGTSLPGRGRDLWPEHVETTGVLLDALLRRAPGARVVVSGSSAEYGPPPAGRASRGVAESAPAEPVSPYGASKLSQTLLALSYRHRGLDVRVARIFNVIGPGLPEHMAPGAFSAQIARIERGLQPPRMLVGDLRPQRDYIDVRDAARALAALSRRGRGGEVYNVCSGRLLPMRSLLYSLISLSGKRIRVAVDPRRLRTGEVLKIAGRREKIAAAVGWRPSVPIETSLRDTLEWYRRRTA